MNIKKIVLGLTKVLKGIFKGLELYSKIVVFGVVIIISAQVVARKFLKNSITWSEEVALLLMVWVAFITTAIGVAKNIHIRIELLYKHFPKKVKTFLTWLEYVVTLFVGLMLLIYGSKLVKATLHSTLPTTKWPSFLLYLMIPVGGFFIIYCTLLHMFFPEAAKIFAEDDEIPDDNSDVVGSDVVDQIEPAVAEELAQLTSKEENP